MRRVSEMRFGLDVFDWDELNGKRVAILTNFTAVDSNLEHILDRAFEEGVNVVRVFTPEHGLFGAADGVGVEDSIHPDYGYKIVSLYGERKRPSAEMLSDVDVMVYDIQDVGLRYFTYIYTMAYAMEEASKVGVEFIVLDRPNPLGRKVVGPRIPDDMESFVGGYRLPLRYGLTPGELSLYFKELKGLDLKLKVVKMEGWSGETFDKTGSLWNLPSPNLPTFSSLLAYTGMVFLEGTNVSVGRGTTKPFEFIGAPWIDSKEMYGFLRERHPGLRVRRRDFTPMHNLYSGQVCRGVEFFPEPDDDFYSVAIDVLRYLREKPEFEVNEHLDRLAGVRDFVDHLDDYDLSAPGDYIYEASKVLLYGGDLG